MSDIVESYYAEPNTISKIVAESKTQKAAVIKIMDLANRVSNGRYGESEVAKMVKDMKGGLQTVFARDVARDILEDEKRWKLERDREWLALNPPLITISKAIGKLDENLAKWFEEAKGDPFRAFAWGSNAFKWAAERKVYLDIKNEMNFITNLGMEPSNLTAGAWKSILERIKKEALNMARGGSRSTSQVSNLADDCLMAAKANVARGDDWEVNSVNYWFAKKEQYDRGEVD